MCKLSFLAMNTTDSEIPDVNPVLEILPYQFEPMRQPRQNILNENSSSDEGDSSDIDDHVDNQRLLNTAWCQCGNCMPMTTVDECVCCAEIDKVHQQAETAELQCITEQESFIANCLNRHVLHVCMYGYLENVGPFDDNDPINEIYRHIAYRRFVRWIWHRLGRHHRKVLPACVVKKIAFHLNSTVVFNIPGFE